MVGKLQYKIAYFQQNCYDDLYYISLLAKNRQISIYIKPYLCIHVIFCY